MAKFQIGKTFDIESVKVKSGGRKGEREQVSREAADNQDLFLACHVNFLCFLSSFVFTVVRNVRLVRILLGVHTQPAKDDERRRRTCVEPQYRLEYDRRCVRPWLAQTLTATVS